MRIHLLTSDKYIAAVYPYAWLLKKYWPNHPEVLVGGFTPPANPLPPGFKFVKIGEMADYPIDRWSDALIRFLELVPDDIVLFTLEDMWIIEPVKTDVIKMAYDYMKQFEYVARLDLTGDRLNAYGGNVSMYGELGEHKLIWSDPDSQYHMSTMPAFWRKEHLLEVLIPGETPWQVELQGTPRLSLLRDKMIVIGTSAWPIRNTLAFRGGDTQKLLLDEVDPDDVTEMRRLGLLELFEQNEEETP